ncbi:hypothetical protein Esti_000334 [Eimeria stiedai]
MAFFHYFHIIGYSRSSDNPRQQPRNNLLKPSLGSIGERRRPHFIDLSLHEETLTATDDSSAPNELRRRLPGRVVPPSDDASSPPAEASASSESPLSAAATTAAEAGAAAEGEVTVDGREQLQNGNPLWRLLCLIASMCSRSWTVLASLPAAANRTLHQGQNIIAALLAPRSFTESFEARYGTRHPPFFQGSLRDAFDEARSLQKPLMVYLDDVGPLAHAACRDVLCSPIFIDIIQTHGFLFVGLHAGSLDAAWLERMLRARQLPCLVFFLPNPALRRNPPRDPQLRWQSLAPRWLYSALQGSWAEADVLTEVMGAVDRYYQDKDECNRKEEEAKQNQILRKQQEDAFEEIQRHESLRLSRQREERQQQAEKEKQQQEAAQRKAARQEQRQQQRELLQQQRIAAAADFRAQDEQQLSELPPDQRTTICLRLPSGFRVTRDFSRRAPLSELHRWAACATHYAQEARHTVPDRFDLVVPPKTPLPQEGTLDDFGLHPNSVVLVVEIESDEEDT